MHHRGARKEPAEHKQRAAERERRGGGKQRLSSLPAAAASQRSPSGGRLAEAQQQRRRLSGVANRCRDSRQETVAASGFQSATDRCDLLRDGDVSALNARPG